MSDAGIEAHGELSSPIWNALGTRQAHLGEANVLARRYQPDVAPFAAVADELPAAFEALHELMRPGDTAAVVRADIERRGEIPFLHVFGGNLGAIALYERLGFRLSRIFMLNQIIRGDSDAAATAAPLHGS